MNHRGAGAVLGSPLKQNVGTSNIANAETARYKAKKSILKTL